MIQRIFRVAAVAALVLLISGAVPTDAKYRYGSYAKAGEGTYAKGSLECCRYATVACRG